jgi:hypothetical protein
VAEEGDASQPSLQSTATARGGAVTRGASSSSSSASCERSGAGEGRFKGTDVPKGGVVLELGCALSAVVCLLPKAAKNEGVVGAAEEEVGDPRVRTTRKEGQGGKCLVTQPTATFETAP